MILSYLPLRQQLQLQRVSSSWKTTVEGCLSHRRRLDVTEDIGEDLRLQIFMRLLPKMTALRSIRLRARFPVRYNGGTSTRAIQLIAQYCRQLEEMDMSCLTFDRTPSCKESIRGLCVSCPGLQRVTMPTNCDNSKLVVLLSHLPGLRELDLSSSRVKGNCFSKLSTALEKLVLRNCDEVVSADLRHLKARYSSLRELRLPMWTTFSAADLKAVTSACTGLELLELGRVELPLEQCLPAGGLPSLRKLFIWDTDGHTPGARGGDWDLTLQRLPAMLPGLTALRIQHCCQVEETGGGDRWSSCMCRTTRHLSSPHCYGWRPMTEAVLKSLHGSQLQELGFGEQGDLAYECVLGVVLACPQMTELAVYQDPHARVDAESTKSSKQWYTSLLEALTQQMGPERRLVLHVGEHVSAMLSDQVATTGGRLRVVIAVNPYPYPW